MQRGPERRVWRTVDVVVEARRTARRRRRTSARCSRAGSGRGCGRAGRRRRRPGRSTTGARNAQAAQLRPEAPSAARSAGGAGAAAAHDGAASPGRRAPSPRCGDASRSSDVLHRMRCAAVGRLLAASRPPRPAPSASASAGEAEPLSAACTAVHSCSEIFGYLVPRLSPVRPLARPTASTHTFSSGRPRPAWPAPSAVGRDVAESGARRESPVASGSRRSSRRSRSGRCPSAPGR